MAEPKTFGGRVALLRKGLKLRLDDLARLLKVSHAYLSMIEKGRTKPTDALANRLAETFGVEPAWLRTGRSPVFRADFLEAIEQYAATTANDHPLRSSRFRSLLRAVQGSSTLSVDLLQEFGLELRLALKVDEISTGTGLQWHSPFPLEMPARLLLVVRERLGRLTAIEELLKEWGSDHRELNDWLMLVVTHELIRRDTTTDLRLAAMILRALSDRLEQRATSPAVRLEQPSTPGRFVDDVLNNLGIGPVTETPPPSPRGTRAIRIPRREPTE